VRENGAGLDSIKRRRRVAFVVRRYLLLYEFSFANAKVFDGLPHSRRVKVEVNVLELAEGANFLDVVAFGWLVFLLSLRLWQDDALLPVHMAEWRIFMHFIKYLPKFTLVFTYRFL